MHLTYNVFEEIEEDGQRRMIMNSLSGWERNHVFMNIAGKFRDLSMISGMDTDADTRAHCTLDFNRDGFSDVAVVNGTKPQLQLFENRLGVLSSNSGNFVAVKLVGGNQTALPSNEWSCRDAVGTLVTVSAANLKYVRELRFGEGFAGQNSTTLILGIEDAASADLEVKWLSGKKQSFKNIPAGKLATIFENPQESENETGMIIEDYRKELIPNEVTSDDQVSHKAKLEIQFDAESESNYYLVTSMATWCSACKKIRPQLDLINDHLNDSIFLAAIPFDENDTQEALKKYVDTHNPPYQLLFETTDTQRESFAEILATRRGKAALPGSILVDKNGHVIESWLSVPTLSELSSILQKKSDQE